MDVRRAYCSAVDRNVPVVLRSGARARDVDMEDPADLVCLDYKVRCTGWCCPLFSVDEGDEFIGPPRPETTASRDTAASPSEPENRWGPRT